jgi:hypothetical protein
MLPNRIRVTFFHNRVITVILHTMDRLDDGCFDTELNENIGIGAICHEASGIAKVFTSDGELLDAFGTWESAD